MTKIDTLLKTFFENMSNKIELNKGKLSISGLPYGYKNLDIMLNGHNRGNLIFVGSGPSVGKTSFLSCTYEYLLHCNKKVAFVTLDQSPRDMVGLLISSETGIPISFIRNSSISSQELVEMTNATESLSDLPIAFFESFSQESLREYKPDIIFIDSFNMMPIDTSKCRYDQYTYTLIMLKNLALELDIPIVVSVGMNIPKSRYDNRPMLSDLSTIGGLPTYADVILLMHRDELYNSECKQKGLTEITAVKNRNGSMGTVYLQFVEELCKFEDMNR